MSRERRRDTGWWIVRAVWILLSLASAGSAGAAPVDRWGKPSVAVGDSVPDLVIRDMANREVRLSDLRGKIVLLNFWVSWCDECREQAARLRALYERYGARGLAIIGVSYDVDRARAEEFCREYRIPWPVEFTGHGFWENRLGRMFHVEDTGAILWIGADGVLEGDYRDLERLDKRLSEQMSRQTGAEESP